MKRLMSVLALLFAVTNLAACGEDKLIAIPGAPADEMIDVEENFSNGATQGGASSHWNMTGTGSIDMALAFYDDGTCEIGSDDPGSSDATSGISWGRSTVYGCLWFATGPDSILLIVDHDGGLVSIELTGIEMAEVGTNWTVNFFHEDMDDPFAITFTECGVALSTDFDCIS